jgi:hypothetical protein
LLIARRLRFRTELRVQVGNRRLVLTNAEVPAALPGVGATELDAGNVVVIAIAVEIVAGSLLFGTDGMTAELAD